MGDDKLHPDARPYKFSLFFNNIAPIMRVSNKRRLEEDDLLTLVPADSHQQASSQFKKHWQAEQAAAAATEPGSKEHRDPSLVRAMWPMAKELARPAALIHLLGSVLGFTGTLVVRQSLLLIEEITACTAGVAAANAANATLVALNATAAPPLELGSLLDLGVPAECRTLEKVSPGFVWAAVMFGAQLIVAFSQSHQQIMMTRAAMRVRIGLISTLYRKCLRLSGLGSANTGEIQNLMANDCQASEPQLPALALALAVALAFALAFALALAPSLTSRPHLSTSLASSS